MDVTDASFADDVVAASHQTPVLVDFWAPWCGPCQVLGPVLERLAERAAGRWRLAKVNTETEVQLALQYRVGSIPHVKLFAKGAVTAEFSGALPEAEVQRFLDTHVGSPVRDKLAAADEALGAGNPQAAKALLEEARTLEPGNVELTIRLAEVTFADDPDAALDLVRNVRLGDPKFEQVEALRDLQHLRTLAAATAPTDGSAAWPDYQAAAQAFVARRYDDAAKLLIATLRRDRKLDTDGARRACVALFRWLGDAHPVTRTHRRTFASALY